MEAGVSQPQPEHPDAGALRQAQAEFFASGVTRSYSFRISMLKRLRDVLRDHEQEMLEALEEDLGKSAFEAYSNEIGLVYHEIRYVLARLKRWMKPSRVIPELHLLPGTGKILPEPYGSVLIIAPWNYPMQLLFMPLVGAIAAGNTAVLKPSELTPRTSALSRRIIEENFSSSFLALVEGGPEETRQLIDQGFDYLFFTGSVPVGRKIMEAAAPHLTPLTLELGGKSPVIVEPDADLRTAARKIVFGKYNNAGQTCVAPDYVLVHRQVEQNFLAEIKSAIELMYPDGGRGSDYGKIVNQRHFDRLSGLMDESSERLFFGGQRDREIRHIAPSIYWPVSFEDPLMRDEIFGPLLPVIGYDDIEDAADSIRSLPRPLALYLFTRNRKTRDWLVGSIPFGGGMVNGSLLHVASHKLPFGGVGPSGMGNYHGEASFRCFTHYKSMLYQPASLDPGLAYPHRHISMKLLKTVLK